MVLACIVRLSLFWAIVLVLIGNSGQTREHNSKDHNEVGNITPVIHIQDPEPPHTQGNESSQQQLHHGEGIITPGIHVQAEEDDSLHQELHGENIIRAGTHQQEQDPLHTQEIEYISQTMEECNINNAGETEAVQVVQDDQRVERQEPFIYLHEDSHTGFSTFGATCPQAGCSSWTDHSQCNIQETTDESFVSLKKAKKLKTIRGLHEATKLSNGRTCNKGMSVTYCGYHFEENNLVITKLLGKGVNGEVNEMLDMTTNKRFAEKKVKYEEFRQEEVCGQIAAQSTIPLVPRILEVTVQDEDVRIDMESLPENSQTIGDVLDDMRLYPENHQFLFPLWLYIWERGLFLLSQLHRAGYLHNDPNMGNVMVTPSGDIVLIDYGCASKINDNSLDNEFQIRTEEKDVTNFTKIMTDVLQELIQATENFPCFLERITAINEMFYRRQTTAHEYYVSVSDMCNNNFDDREQLKRNLAEIVEGLDISREIKYPDKK